MRKELVRLSPSIEISVDNRSGRQLDEDSISSVAAAVLERLGINNGELGVSLVSREEMERFNLRHMGRQGATDVLSFPLDMDEADTAEGVPRLLGDVIVCPEVAAAQAQGQGNTLAEEICLLLIHGILHIAGHDHETDTGEMERIQDELFRDLCSGGT